MRHRTSVQARVKTFHLTSLASCEHWAFGKRRQRVDSAREELDLHRRRSLRASFDIGVSSAGSKCAKCLIRKLFVRTIGHIIVVQNSPEGLSVTLGVLN